MGVDPRNPESRWPWWVGGDLWTERTVVDRTRGECQAGVLADGRKVRR